MKHIFALFGILLSLESYAQEDSLLNEILDFPVTKKILVAQSRNVVMEKFKEDNKTKVLDVITFVEDSILDTNEVFLRAIEKGIIGIWSTRYDFLLNSTIDYNPRQSEKTLVYFDDDLYETIYHWLLENKKDALSDLDNVDLSSEKRDFLRIMIEYILRYENEFSSQSLLNNMSDTFVSNYPQSRYIPFIREYIRHKYEARKMGFGFGMGGTGIAYNGPISAMFRNTGALNIYFETSYKGLFFEYCGYLGSVKNKDSLENNKNVWRPNTDISSIYTGLNAGLKVYDNRFFRIIPHSGVLIQSYSVAIPEEDRPHEYHETSLNSIVNYSMGFSVDIKLGGRADITNGGLIMGLPESEAFYNIRLRYAYSGPIISNSPLNLKGGIHFITASFGLYARGSKRVK